MCVSVLCGIRAVLARGAIRTHSGEVRIEAMVGSDAALLGVLSQWCAGAAERQRPHSISSGLTKLRSDLDLIRFRHSMFTGLSSRDPDPDRISVSSAQ